MKKFFIVFVIFELISVLTSSCTGDENNAELYNEQHLNVNKIEITQDTTKSSMSDTDGIEEDEEQENFNVLLCNLFEGYEITDLYINDTKAPSTIKEKSSIVLHINSYSKLEGLTIKCSIRTTDGSNSYIRNLTGYVSLINHTSLVTVNINDAFLGLTPISFNANVVDYTKN